MVDPGSVFTADGQASLSFIPGAFVAPADHSAVNFDVTPVRQFPSPTGIHLATNVYCFTGTSPMASRAQVLITLRYSNGVPAPGDIYGYQGQGPWQRLGSTGSAAPYTISVRANSLGCYAGGYPATAGSAQGARVGGGQTLPIVVALIILLVVLAGIPLAILRRREEPAASDDSPS